MLTGYIKCTEVRKLLLRYIHFDLTKTEMNRVAIHLRNCPKCMEKYSALQKRKKTLKDRMYKIEKCLRRQDEISCYIDNECSEDQIFIIEGMLLCDKKYKKELIENESLKRLLQESRKKIAENFKTIYTEKIIEKIKKKKESKIRKIIQLFRQLLHGFVKY